MILLFPAVIKTNHGYVPMVLDEYNTIVRDYYDQKTEEENEAWAIATAASVHLEKKLEKKMEKELAMTSTRRNEVLRLFGLILNKTNAQVEENLKTDKAMKKAFEYRLDPNYDLETLKYEFRQISHRINNPEGA